MVVYDNLTSFAGKPVVDFLDMQSYDPNKDCTHNLPDEEFFADPGRVAWRLHTTGCCAVRDKFMEMVDTTKVTHLVAGYDVWIDAEDGPRLPALRALFLGDVIPDDQQISWIEQGDITPLFEAFPHLEHLEVRGSMYLELSPIRSGVLRTLRLESGGLPATIVRAVGDSDLPALEHLDMWLGVEEYGGDATVADLERILNGARLPSLRHLGLEDSEIQDEIAAAVAGAPVVARLASLSLALGMLSDRGAEALLSGQPLTHLERLDLHHHFLSEPMMERIRAALPGVQVNLEDRKDAEDDHYVAVSE